MEIDDKQVLLKLAERIKQLRLEKGISQEIAYVDTGINFGRIERAKANIKLITLVKICEYFEIAPTTFFNDW